MIGILETAVYQSCKWLVNVATENRRRQFSVTNKTFSPYEISYIDEMSGLKQDRYGHKTNVFVQSLLYEYSVTLNM